MRPTILKLSLSVLFVFIMGAACQDDNLNSLDYEEGYISGWFKSREVGPNGQATGEETEIGYCILLKGSENANSNQPMDFYTFNFPDSLFDFPDPDLYPLYNNNTCGPVFSPDSLKVIYKFKFDFETVSEPNKVNFTTWCFSLLPAFEWEKYEQITLNSIIID